MKHVPKRMLHAVLGATLVLPAALLLPTGLDAQSRGGSATGQATVDEQIERALMAAPERMRDGAAVIGFDESGSSVVLREGSNGLMCWDSSDEPGQQGRFSAQCTSENNRARVEQNHRIVNDAADPQARFEELEESGEREVAEFGTLYYHLIGDDAETGRLHVTVAVPYATPESTGLPAERRPAGLWLMDAGTSGAHLMIPGM